MLLKWEKSAVKYSTEKSLFFNFVDLSTISCPNCDKQGRRYWGAGGRHGLPTFLRSKKKKGKQSEKRKTFKAETVKTLSPTSKCYCFSHSRVSRIQKFFWSANHGGRQYLSVFHGPSTLKSILLALINWWLNHFFKSIWWKKQQQFRLFQFLS